MSCSIAILNDQRVQSFLRPIQTILSKLYRNYEHGCWKLKSHLDDDPDSGFPFEISHGSHGSHGSHDYIYIYKLYGVWEIL